MGHLQYAWQTASGYIQGRPATIWTANKVEEGERKGRKVEE